MDCQYTDSFRINIVCCPSRELIFKEDGLYLDIDHKRQRIDVIYRFFELFDLKNIPKMDLILYAVRKQTVLITPPLKSYLE